MKVSMKLIAFALVFGFNHPALADQKPRLTFGNLPAFKAKELVDQWKQALPSVVNYAIFDARHEEVSLAGKTILLFGTFGSRYSNTTITDDEFELAMFEVLSDRGCNNPDISFLLSNGYELFVEFTSVDLVRSISWTLSDVQCPRQ